MTSTIKNWALWGTGLSTAALIAGASIYLDMPAGANAAPAAIAAPPAVPVTVATSSRRVLPHGRRFPAVWKRSTGCRSAPVSKARWKPCISAKGRW